MVSVPPLPPESILFTMNIPCIHSRIPNDGEILLLPLISLVYQVEQSDEVNTLINEVNKEYPFWRPHQDKEYQFGSIHAMPKEEHHEDSIGVLDDIQQNISNVESKNYDGPSESIYQSSTEAVPTTIPAPVICADTVSIKTGSSNSIAATVAAAAADLYANDLAITDPGMVSNEDGNLVLIADNDNDNNPPLLPPEQNLPCMHSINDEVYEEYSFWRPHQDKEYSVDSIPVSYKIDNAKYYSSTTLAISVHVSSHLSTLN